jgi:hypothetical protein
MQPQEMQYATAAKLQCCEDGFVFAQTHPKPIVPISLHRVIGLRPSQCLRVSSRD